MPIETKVRPQEGFLYLAASPQVSRTRYDVAVPYPTRGSAAFETTRMVDAGRSANGALVGRMVGRACDKQSMAWSVMDCGQWWALNRFLEAGNFTFYCHYFNFNLGVWSTRLFYAGDVKCSPGLVDAGTGAPRQIRDASLNVIDCGVV